jgi:hypothetical protein
MPASKRVSRQRSPETPQTPLVIKLPEQPSGKQNSVRVKTDLYKVDCWIPPNFFATPKTLNTTSPG